MNETLIKQQIANTNDNQIFYYILSYIPLAIIVVGIIGNAVSFCVYRFHDSFNKLPSMIYLSFVAVTDTVSLFEWNLDHFLMPNKGLSVVNLTCQIASFFQYASLESSALLFSFISVDRYLTVIYRPGSVVGKLPFRTRKSALAWSSLVIVFTCILNIHIIVIPHYRDVILSTIGNDTNNTVTTLKYIVNCNKYTTGFEIFPQWENIHLVIYNVVPFLVMLTFNSLLIRNVLVNMSNRHKTDNSNKGYRRKQRLTISLLVMTFLFLAMTLPSSIIYIFFAKSTSRNFRFIVDHVAFTNHSSLWLISFATNTKFRQLFTQIVCTLMAKILKFERTRHEPETGNASKSIKLSSVVDKPTLGKRKLIAATESVNREPVNSESLV